MKVYIHNPYFIRLQPIDAHLSHKTTYLYIVPISHIQRSAGHTNINLMPTPWKSHIKELNVNDSFFDPASIIRVFWTILCPARISHYYFLLLFYVLMNLSLAG